VVGIVNGEIVKVADENIQKEIDINTEVLGIDNIEIVKVTDDSVQKEIDIKSEIILIPPSLKISESSSNGSYRNTDEV
jgi:hypothetical protein